MKRILLILFVLCLAAVLITAPAFASEAELPDYDEVIAIVHTNDVHGYIDVEPYVKGLKTQLEESGEYSLVLAVNAGDVYAGGYAAAHMYDGEFIPAIMDKVYDYMTWGNDGGIADGFIRTYLLSILGEAGGMTSLVGNAVAMHDIDMAAYVESYVPTVGADTLVTLYPEALTMKADGTLDWSGARLPDYDLTEGETLPGTALVTTGKGTMIGLFGLTTNASPDETKDPDIRALKGTLEAAAECVAELQADGAGVVVGICHTGWTGADSLETSGNDTNSAQIALNVPGIDAIVDGHTHSTICDGEGWLFDETESKTIVNQAHCWGDAIGVMTLYLKDGKCVAKDCRVLTAEEYENAVEPDAEVQAVVDACHERLYADGYTTVLAETPYFLNGERLSAGNEGGSVRGNETNLGDLMMDVILAVCSEKMGTKYDFAAYPGFHLRASIEAGNITPADIQSVFGHPTILYYDTYTAADVLAMVTAGLQSVYPESESTGFMQYSGICVTYTDNGGRGTPVTISVGDTLIYDATAGGIQVEDDWTCSGVATLTGDEADNYTGDGANWIVHDQPELHALVEN